ncbi:hypothetical protein N7492_000749 [Penicillium capsulatum]|uniref:Transposase Tc1-like domain-containing protein n=1 Tax=Penicillium capsulatum TaxID=69766 RepID=A0A9W9IQ55_9EURO|nr:hypothetical protein N7492_000749 [Penicillium capsulatum]KAJ6130192.1 hypothetical protein N7512_002972 [Penicillium capsulatum]
MPPIRTARAPVRPPRRRNCELDPYIRTKLVELRQTAEIYAKYPSIPISTIKSTVYRASQRVENQTSPRSRRPRSLDDDDKSKLLHSIDENPRVTYDELIATVDFKAYRSTIWRLLHEEGRRK